MSQILNIILKAAEVIGAVGVITAATTAAVSKVFDTKMKPLTNRDRMQLRFQIVSFASDLHKGVPHTRDEYLSVFELIDEYKDICEKLKLKNHLFEEECEYIDKCFQNMDILNKGKEPIAK